MSLPIPRLLFLWSVALVAFLGVPLKFPFPLFYTRKSEAESFPSTKKAPLPLPQADVLALATKIWKLLETRCYKRATLKKEDFFRFLGNLGSSPSKRTLFLAINRYFALQGLERTSLREDSDPEYFIPFRTGPHQTLMQWHIGVFFKDTGSHYEVETLLDGYPGKRKGLRPGDRILSAILPTHRIEPFHPHRSFQNGQKKYDPLEDDSLDDISQYGSLDDVPRKKRGVPLGLLVERKKQRFLIRVSPLFESLSFSLWKSMFNSKRIYHLEDQKVGYLRILGTPLTPPFFQPLIVRAFFLKLLKEVDTLVLNVRENRWSGAALESALFASSQKRLVILQGKQTKTVGRLFSSELASNERVEILGFISSTPLTVVSHFFIDSPPSLLALETKVLDKKIRTHPKTSAQTRLILRKIGIQLDERHGDFQKTLPTTRRSTKPR